MRTLTLRFFLLTLVSTLTATSHASHERNCSCLNDRDVNRIIRDYSIIITAGPDYRQVAERRLVEDFVAISDSFAYINSAPLNGSTFRTRDLFLTFLEGEFTQLQEDLQTLFLSHTCDTITWYNSVTVNRDGAFVVVRGIDILFVNGRKRITKIMRELNSAAQLYALFSEPSDRPDCKVDWKPVVGMEGTGREEARCGACRK